jgi:hypothetical protein
MHNDKSLVSYGGKKWVAGFVVVGPNEEWLMSFHTATALNIVKMDEQSIQIINKPSVDQSNKGNGRYSKEEFKEMFPNLFRGVLG